MAEPVDDIRITPLRPQDLGEALAIEEEVYPPFLVEDEQVFMSRMALKASFCLAARREGALAGYLLAHGWRREAPPAIGTAVTDAGVGDGEAGEILFIHDLAVSPRARGLKIGEKLIAEAFARAAQKGLRTAELIAVEGAAPYWRGQGFAEAAPSPALREKLASYGPDARWMTRSIP